MLSRTADHLFWMARQMERAENLARLLDVSLAVSLLPASRGGADVSAPLVLTGTLDAYLARHGEPDASRVLAFMSFDAGNPSSILSCIRHARDNAHAVRGKITAEMWMSINATWLEAREFAQGGAGDQAFFDWVKERSHLFRGATHGTCQRTDAFSFIRLGTFIERADNTARLLEVKRHLLDDADAADYYAWSALLRAVGAFEAYHALYRDAPSGRRVAELLLLRPDMPRSLRACFDEIYKWLARLEGDNGRAAKRLAAELRAAQAYTSVDEVFDAGLHDYLTRMLGDITRLGALVHEAYLEAA
ncbi:alpha-E domain-containing protein [Crenobacter caeni]|uniref:Alpha-E domain-containing protein n=1 Tax=Crenobacter caeni TaxID=2705474 RepID=A0A6B2KRV5_9NEIS|nr:alpha-E domain-containing protein [Crenobacter caeni]NDV12677.1 alpha-E domain-containing protein [Crenobacter caeni]